MKTDCCDIRNNFPWNEFDCIRLGGYSWSMQNEARTFKALSDETRLKILALLLDGELCVCEIMAALDLPQSTTSRHLSYLRKIGWVCDRRQGLWMYYRLNNDQPLIRELTGVLEKYLKSGPAWEASLARLQLFREDDSRTVCRVR